MYRYSVRSAAATARTYSSCDRVVPVLHRRGDDAGRCGGHERLGERRAGHERALRFELGRVGVRDLRDRRRCRHEVHLDPCEPRDHQLEEVRMVEQVAHERPLARVAEAVHAVTDVGEEALARLLAVVADVDACFDLCGDGRRRRVLDRSAQLRRVDRFAVATASVELGQRMRPRQAAGVRREDPRLARQHGSSLTAGRRAGCPPGSNRVIAARRTRANLPRTRPRRGSHPCPCGRRGRTAS